MRLIYQGLTYTTSTPTRSPVPTRDVNWRYRVPGGNYGVAIAPQHYVPPSTINWRYQLPGELL